MRVYTAVTRDSDVSLLLTDTLVAFMLIYLFSFLACFSGVCVVHFLVLDFVVFKDDYTVYTAVYLGGSPGF